MRGINVFHIWSIRLNACKPAAFECSSNGSPRLAIHRLIGYSSTHPGCEQEHVVQFRHVEAVQSAPREHPGASEKSLVAIN